MIDTLLRVLPLFAVMALGALSGALGLFAEPKGAIAALNRFALYVAFPLLVVASLADGTKALAGGAGFYAAHGVALVAQLVLLVGVRRVWGPVREEGGAMILGGIFGNIAYIGIPFCVATLGEGVTGLAALSAALHIVVGMGLGPLLLVGGEGRPWGEVVRRVLVQPLVWSPVAGLGLRLLPWSEVSAQAVRYAAPVGAAASPVALFLIGYYVFVNRGVLTRPDARLATVSVAKLAVYPAVAWAAAWLTARWLPLTPVEVAVVVAMAAMPVAVTTFALAEEFGRGQATLSRAVVATTLLSVVTLPVWASLVG